MISPSVNHGIWAPSNFLIILQFSSLFPTTPYMTVEKVSCFLAKVSPPVLLFHSFFPSHGFCMSIFLPVSCNFSLFSLFFSIYVLMSSAFLHHQCCCMYNGRELTFLILPAFSSLVFLKELFKLILSNSLPSKRCFNKTSTWFWCMPTRLENHFPSLYLEVNQEAHYYYYKLWVHIMVFRGMLIYTYSDTEESAFDWLRWCLNLETVIVGELVRFKFCLWVTKNPNGKIFFSL